MSERIDLDAHDPDCLCDGCIYAMWDAIGEIVEADRAADLTRHNVALPAAVARFGVDT